MSSLLTYLYYFLAGYLGLTVFFYMLSLVSTKAGFVARLLAAYISMIITALAGVFISIAFRLFGDASNSQWATGRVFEYIMALTTGVRFKIVDPKGHLERTRPAVFVGNHQTELDVLMLGIIFPKHTSVTAKSSLKRMPFLGWFMTLSNSIFIDRKNSKDAREAMRGAADQIRAQRQNVWMFPEGTRSYAKDPMLLPFKKGAFHLAVQAQVPIVPVVVANYSHVLWVKGLVFKSGSIPMKVLDPIPTTGLTPADVDELTRTTRERMLKELINLTAEVRGQPIPISAETVKATGVEIRN
ncbi:putative 1-acyl-sn-glycerol-3-phosphate acyltransferase beta protein [Phaeoacremonium minimum UCRPA7]|uniref:1-acyl-sn-glycerol-3-phosphate acyltransferase n=1 Tax=Phaeoacremonium minimum (strain UCR-PA7) TaxID=1286976 RepID=R8BXM6_PHAM7|nr:putative 1-acyl-sn-glycerol-3-phosphate acyltransferase beta protein [Phaeoacremonium minimum UCRPA7]EOO04080.1 putative 1-acyl-sn-glycerol-3-phosphate acyltransferase beta protein [Phaeoacremonium minimum UCRPA7]